MKLGGTNTIYAVQSNFSDFTQHSLRLLAHASEPIRTTVVDTPYRGGVLCLMWWIRHTEAGYYANMVGYYA